MQWDPTYVSHCCWMAFYLSWDLDDAAITWPIGYKKRRCMLCLGLVEYALVVSRPITVRGIAILHLLCLIVLSCVIYPVLFSIISIIWVIVCQVEPWNDLHCVPYLCMWEKKNVVCPHCLKGRVKAKQNWQRRLQLLHEMYWELRDGNYTVVPENRSHLNLVTTVLCKLVVI